MNTHDITDEMALAFHRALTGGSIGQHEVDEIKVGLRAAFAHFEADCKWLEAAARTVAELAAIIPVSDILGATATCQDMIDYFKRLIADRKRRGEPVAWLVRDDMLATWLFKWVEPEPGLWKYVKPLYTAPQPAEPRLDAPAQVGHTRFGYGVPWSTVIGAAQRYHAIENTPTKEQERMKKAAERLKAIQPAEPVKVVCPKCGVDRAKVPCPGQPMNCHFRGEAQTTEPVKVPSMRDLIADDAYAATFQSVGQYRKALLARYRNSDIGQPAEQPDYTSAAKACRSVGGKFVCGML